MLADPGWKERDGSHHGGHAGLGVMTPVPHRVVGRRHETDDVVTLLLSPPAGGGFRARSGQFNMLTAFGVGEAAISVSSAPHDDGPLQHTVRDVGPVTHALCQARIGEVVGVRGPFGTDWGVGTPQDPGDPVDGELPADGPGPGGDVVVVAGGIGLAPLRGAVYELVARPSHQRRAGVRHRGRPRSLADHLRQRPRGLGARRRAGGGDGRRRSARGGPATSGS